MRFLGFLADMALLPRETEALVRGMEADAFCERLLPVSSGGVTSLFPYDDSSVQACILEAKFEGNRRAAGFLGRALFEFLYEFLAESAAFDRLPPVLIPLPLSTQRLKERGYNQVERALRYALAGGPGNAKLRAELDTGLLRRMRDTLPQTSVSGTKRRTNVAGAFGAGPCSSHRTYIVVDDVITTGNTMLAACEALRAGGAKRLLPLTFAY